MNFFKTQQFKALYQQTWPMLLGLFTIMGSQLVDSAFIGQLGSQPLAVVGFSIPIYQLIIGVQVGLGIATTASISSAIGSNRKLYAKYLGMLVLCIGVTTITVLCVLLWYYQEGIAYSLGAEPSLFQLLRDYWFPWLLSCWLGAILYFGYSICRSHGETLLPGKVMVITSLLNIILDPVFIFTLNMGLAGAAWATCISFIIGCFIIFRAIIQKPYIAMLYNVGRAKKGINTIVKFTIPAMLSQFIPPVSAMLVTVIIASYGDIAVGAWGLANRIEYISIIMILALTMALPPMIGNLKGRNKIPEIFFLVKTAMKTIIVFQLAITLFILVISKPVANLLSVNSQIESLLLHYLWIVPVSYGALGICMVCVSACNAMGLPKSALVISLLRLFSCYLPLIWVGSEVYGLLGIFIGATIGNFLSGMLGWSIFLQQYKKISKSQPDVKLLSIIKG
ncbi:MATE family efflux transporter [Pseudoalteromonas sp. H105]|jgi:putative MATE family efflux protein|nr:MATE family efflux transporter [Pseudoalteromonas sp. H105]